MPRKLPGDGRNDLQRLRELFPDGVLLQCGKGKAPIRSNWQHLSSKEMTAGYFAGFGNQNIGLLCGPRYHAIDIDHDSAVEPFLNRNPRLRETFRVHGQRGEKLFVQIQGVCPQLKRAPGFEWLSHTTRGGGSNAIVSGLHPVTKEPYRWRSDRSPLVLPFSQLDWTDTPFEDAFSPHTQKPPNSSEYSASLHTSTSLHSVLAWVESGKEQARRAIGFAQHNPELARLYDLFIGRIYEPLSGTRNTTIVRCVPFLFRAMAEGQAKILLTHFYDLNSVSFNDSKEQHESEIDAMINAVADTYACELPPDERTVYSALPTLEKPAFRVCRDLAKRATPGLEPMHFFLSCNQLATRLGKFPSDAQRILKAFERYGLLRTVTAGTRSSPGVQARATIYEWTM